MSKSNLITHSIVHYLTAIHKLYEGNMRSRAVDLANYLGVAKSSVNLAVKKLKEKELIREDDERSLSLTNLGHEQVHTVLASRSLVYYFLKGVGVNENDAKNDACKIEHLLSKDSQRKLFNFLKKMSKNSKYDIEKLKLDICFCEFEKFSEFQDGQIGDDMIAAPTCQK